MDRLGKERRTAVGHAYAQTLPLHTYSSKNVLLPPLPQQKARTPGIQYYTSTYSSAHAGNATNGLLSNVVHSKASPHWQTHFLKELAHKLGDCKSVRVASVSTSEMQDCYQGQPAAHTPLFKTLPALYGQLDTALGPTFQLKEPLLSTTQSDYRRYCRSELASPPGLDAPPIQGTLTKSGALSRLPPHKAPSRVDRQRQLILPSVPIPFGGNTSQYMKSFNVPKALPRFCTPAPDWGKSREADRKNLLRHILEVPKMYVTENQSYGNRRMEPV